MNFHLQFTDSLRDWPLMLTITGSILLFIVWFVFSCAVWADAAEFERRRGKLKFVGPFWWFLITLFFNIPAAAFYWAIHHSTLARKEEDAPVHPPFSPPGDPSKADPFLFQAFLKDDPIAKHVDSQEQLRRFAAWKLSRSQFGESIPTDVEPPQGG